MSLRPVPVKIVFSCTGPLWFSDETNAQVLETLKELGVKTLDSARGYGPSEEKLCGRSQMWSERGQLL